MGGHGVSFVEAERSRAGPAHGQRAPRTGRPVDRPFMPSPVPGCQPGPFCPRRRGGADRLPSCRWHPVV